MFNPIFISGPHGSGKTTLLEKLMKMDERFMLNDFEIDFSSDFPSLKDISHKDRSVLRFLYRIVRAYNSAGLARRNPDRIILTDRSIYDTIAYVNSYHCMKWINDKEYEKLINIISMFDNRNYTIILNPPVVVIDSRLQSRRADKTRIKRDTLFSYEDSNEFIESLHNSFRTYEKSSKAYEKSSNIIYIEDNTETEMQRIMEWITVINPGYLK